MRFKHHLAVSCIAVSVCPATALAAESCREIWEYQIVDTQSAQALKATKKELGVARGSVVATLNALGAQGWRMVSAPDVRTSADDKGNWTVALRPSAVMFERKVRGC